MSHDSAEYVDCDEHPDCVIRRPKEPAAWEAQHVRRRTAPPTPLNLDFERLWRLTGKPRLHPTGFITLDLTETHKLHVWPEEPIRVRTDGMIHDHVFAFQSTVLKGALADQRYHIVPGEHGTHRVYVVDCVSGRCHGQESASGLVKQDDTTYFLERKARRIIFPGETYLFPRETFHTSTPEGFTATLLKITDFGTAASARILFPCGTEPKAFSRTPKGIREERLTWEAIRHAVADLT